RCSASTCWATACATLSTRSGGRDAFKLCPSRPPRGSRKSDTNPDLSTLHGVVFEIFEEVIMTAQPLLDIHDLTVEFTTRRGIVKAVQHVSISVAKGETLGIVGESGSGKSVTSYAVMRILDRAGSIAEGSVMFSGIDVKAASENERRHLRGREISMIFQNPRAALNPIRKAGDQCG